MTINKVIWIIVGVLVLAVVFMGGAIFATLGARRMNVAAYNTRALNAPNNFRAQPNGRQGIAPNVPNNRMKPFNRGNNNQRQRRAVPNTPQNRMMPFNRWNGFPNQPNQNPAPRVAPNQPRVIPQTPQVPPTNPNNRAPRRGL